MATASVAVPAQAAFCNLFFILFVLVSPLCFGVETDKVYLSCNPLYVIYVSRTQEKIRIIGVQAYQ